MSELSDDRRLSLGSVQLYSNRCFRSSSLVSNFSSPAANLLSCWVEVAFICVIVLLERELGKFTSHSYEAARFKRVATDMLARATSYSTYVSIEGMMAGERD